MYSANPYLLCRHSPFYYNYAKHQWTIHLQLLTYTCKFKCAQDLNLHKYYYRKTSHMHWWSIPIQIKLYLSIYRVSSVLVSQVIHHLQHSKSLMWMENLRSLLIPRDGMQVGHNRFSQHHAVLRHFAFRVRLESKPTGIQAVVYKAAWTQLVFAYW